MTSPSARKAEEALRESEAKHRIYVENSPLGIFVVDKNGKYVDVNESACKMTGYSEDELLEMSLQQLLPPEIETQKLDGFKKLKQTGTRRIELILMKKDGSKFHSLLDSAAISEDRFIAFCMDITERKKTEEELKKREEQFRSFVETAQELIWRCDELGRFTYLNPAWEKSHGYKVEEMLGRPFSDFHVPEVFESDMKEFGKLLAGGSVKGYETTQIAKSGKVVNMVFNAIPLLDNKGNIIGTQGTAYDITKRKQLEEQLQIRQRMDSLGTLAGGIAHDFNNILVGVMGNISLLKMESENCTDRQKELLNNANESTNRAANLIRKFQTLSSGAVTKKVSIDLHDISEEVFGLLQQTTDRLIKKEVSFKKGKFFVTGDSGELHQVLLNLATNSTHAIEERGVKTGDYIRITAENYEVSTGDKTGLDEGDYVHIEFKDTGGGMTEEVLKKAFDPMYTTKDMGSKKGQGLGLAMVYNIVTNINNGHIYIDSKKGKGTTFHIYLPKAKSATVVEEENTFEMKGGSETILVVDDEPVIVGLCKNLLTHIGYTVLTASDGKEALKIYKKQQDSIDAVILDLSMPQMSGKQVFQEMLIINSDVKVIISSGHGDEHSKKGILAQAQGNIRKPYKTKDLARALRDVLDK